MSFFGPTSIQREYSIEGHEIKYRDLMEVCQGGPEIGNLIINGQPIGGESRFGGPLLYSDRSIYAPLYIKKFMSSGFILAKIDLPTGAVKLIGKRKGLIFLEKISDGLIHYYRDIDKTIAESISIE
jgi:hypothetical protein